MCSILIKPAKVTAAGNFVSQKTITQSLRGVFSPLYHIFKERNTSSCFYLISVCIDVPVCVSLSSIVSFS